MTKKPSSILEYPIVARKVLNDLVISLPDIGIWVQIPLPEKKSINGVVQQGLPEEFLQQMAVAFKNTWLKGHKHITEKKWVPDASSFKDSTKKAQKDLTVMGFVNKVKPYMSICDNTVRREIKRGMIKCYTTAGGHRRIPESEVERYVRNSENLSKIDARKTGMEL